MQNYIYYQLKPLLPRRLQIALRRKVVAYKRKKYSHIWPIDESAGKAPKNWPGWPDGKKFALVLSHDVDNQRGHDNCLQLMNLEKEMGFRSSFNFVPEKYHVSMDVIETIKKNGFEVGVHGLKHDGKLFFSRNIFNARAKRINQYLQSWGAKGFTSPSTHHRLDWMHELDIEYETSTFDTDPFEPQPDAVGTIFPFLVFKNSDGTSTIASDFPASESCSSSAFQPYSIPASRRSSVSGFQPRSPVKFLRSKRNEMDLTGTSSSASKLSSLKASSPSSYFLELPYTLPQDFTLFVLMQEDNIDIWKIKLDWIVSRGGMALLNSHPDYMNFNGSSESAETYSVEYYKRFLTHIKERYKGQFWNALPKDIAESYKSINGSMIIHHTHSQNVKYNKNNEAPKNIQTNDQPFKKERYPVLLHKESEENKDTSICLIDPLTDPRWDKFVENHHFGWVCHLSGWKYILENSFKHMKGYYIVKLKNGSNEIEAGLPIFLVKSKLIGNRLVSIPYATLCDPLSTNILDLQELISYAIVLMKNIKYSYFEIKTFTLDNDATDINLSKSSNYCNHYLYINRKIEDIFYSFHRKTVRQSINRALKTNIKLKIAEKESDVLDFYQLYISTRKTIGLPPQPYLFFLNLWKTFSAKDKIELLLAEKEGKIIAGVILLKYKNRVSAEYAGWNRKYGKLCPNHFLYWEAIKLSKAEGYQIFDFGRTSKTNINLVAFKERWGTSVVDLPYYYYIQNFGDIPRERESSFLYGLIQMVCKKSPLALNKAIGNFLYSHLG